MVSVSIVHVANSLLNHARFGQFLARVVLAVFQMIGEHHLSWCYCAATQRTATRVHAHYTAVCGASVGGY